MKLFDVIDNLSASKEHIYDEDVEKAIVPYMVNTTFSQYYDTIMYANELNLRPDVTKKMCYDYYHFAVQPKKKRFAKWGSTKKEETTILLADYFCCNFRRAEEYMKLLSSDDIELIRQKMDKGGRE